MGTLMKSLNRQASAGDLKLGLFMPCYIDLMYPKAGIATLELLERFGLNIEYPLSQTCCGQPMSNSGDQANAAYGCFMMGPSATGDIEATLVHGAQGPRSLNVFFLPRSTEV
jgi:hypothetical protein